MSLIYIVEDDASIREIEIIALKNSGYEIAGFERGSELYRKLSERMPDLILLDVMLPDESGIEILRRLKNKPQTSKIPVIMVTAKTTEFDLVKGFEEGAEDYIRKPFSVMELLSRVKALLRRTQEEKPKTLEVGGIVMDLDRHLVIIGDRQIELTYKEYELLHYMMINRNLVLTRDKIMLAVWGTDYEGESRTVDMHIKTLRQKLGSYGSLIGTIRNVGYVLSENKES